MSHFNNSFIQFNNRISSIQRAVSDGNITKMWKESKEKFGQNCLLVKCPPMHLLAKCPLAKCPLAKWALVKCPGFSAAICVAAMQSVAAHPVPAYCMHALHCTQARSHGGGGRGGAEPPLEKFEPPLGCPP